MVIMLQTSSGKGSEADEKPYLRVRPLLLITWSEAVNSTDIAITGNEPAPALDARLPGHGTGMVTGMGTAERRWSSHWGSEAGVGKTSQQTLALSGLAGTISQLCWEGWRGEEGDLERGSPLPHPSRKGDG